MTIPPFSVREPSGTETPVTVEVPHAGLFVDGPTLSSLAAPARSLGKDADLYVDELYTHAPSVGATLLTAHASRYVCDLNRSEHDIDEGSVHQASSRTRATRGVIWQLTGEGAPVLDAPLARHELERRLNTYYRPYHQTLARILEEKRAQFGFAFLLAAHSMPSVAKAASSNDFVVRADVVPGTRGRTSASEAFIQCVDKHARAHGLSVMHDDPYQGGFTTQYYGRPDLRVHVIQIELARRLYMDEATLQTNAHFERIRAWCTSLVEALGRIRP